MTTPICDYEGSHYRDDFWGQGRDYEDAAERLALRALLPPTGRRLIEIGAGYGRLADLYAGYQQVYLLDYARTQIQQAQEHISNRKERQERRPSAKDSASSAVPKGTAQPGSSDPCRQPPDLAIRREQSRITYVVGDIYNLPFNDGFFDTAVTVRVLHHIGDIPAALSEIARLLAPGGTYVLEYANKRHLKGIVRYLLGRQPSPFAREPWEFVKLNYDFHPAYMEEQLQAAGFRLGPQRASSFFRVPLLKRFMGTRLLAAADGLLQVPLAGLKPAPSVFVQATVYKPAMSEPASPWRCPRCHAGILTAENAASAEGLQETFASSAAKENALVCENCHARWSTADGIYDFKNPLHE